jgi:ribosomal protein S18 acetylase RimI-like enzyme
MNILKTEHSIYLPCLKGYVFYVDEDKKGEECIIYNLFVNKEHRKRGMGTYLVKKALDEIFNAGYKKAFVVVEDKKLIPFYKKLGFVKTRYNQMHCFKENL